MPPAQPAMPGGYNRRTEQMSFREPVPAPDRPSTGDPGDARRNGSSDPQIEDYDQAQSDASDPQPPSRNGVDEDMATVALDSALLKGAQIDPAPSRTVRGREVVDWNSMSDAEIMLRVREGDDSAFDLLVHKYHKPIIHFMFRMVHNQAVAEELAQEVFLRVYRSRETYEPSAKFTTWLYRIATNLAVNHARDTRHERPEVQVSLDEPDEENGTTIELPDGTMNAEQMIVRRERMLAIRKKVEALPEQQRLAVIMHKYQQMDYKQIAEVLKKSESATKSLLFRAYETLREQLKEFM